MITKIIVLTCISMITLNADVEDNLVDETVYKQTIEENVLKNNDEFYKTKIGKKIQGMDKRHKRIKKLEASINIKVKKFYSLYKKAKSYTKNSNCSMVKQAIEMLDGDIKSLNNLNENMSDKKVDINSLKAMVTSLEQDKKNICKGE